MCELMAVSKNFRGHSHLLCSTKKSFQIRLASQFIRQLRWIQGAGQGRRPKRECEIRCSFIDNCKFF